MIIGLCGSKHSGKDTVAAHLVKKYGYERRAFADPVKKSIAALFGIPFSAIDQYKNDEHISIHIVRDNGLSVLEIKNLTFREFIQRYATEGHRDIPEMGDDFWVDLTLPVRGYYEGRDLVITDVRFKSEAKRIRHLDGVIVEVNRPGLDSKDQHRSEQEFKELAIDYTIFNNGTIDDLETGVELMMKNVQLISAYYGYDG